jgi:hypothetical protein
VALVYGVEKFSGAGEAKYAIGRSASRLLRPLRGAESLDLITDEEVARRALTVYHS